MGREVKLPLNGKYLKLAFIAIFATLGASAPYWLGIEAHAWLVVGGTMLGILIGAAISFRLFGLAFTAWKKWMGGLSLASVFAGGCGVLFGLILSILGLFLAREIAGRANPIGEAAGAILLILGSTHIALAKRQDFIALLRPNEGLLERTMAKPSQKTSCKVLDTSAIIDGRIADICHTGFLEGTLIVPGFVLAELQRIADSSDTLKRNRGRRGLDILNRMQKESMVTVKICDRDFDDLTEVDTKIVRLARILEARVITNDFNLNKVAELYGVPVLNINELSNAIKPIVLPGEEMQVHIIKDGKEFGQGIGYLEDGTMVVVDGGRPHIGADLDVLVTSVLQTSAGRMIFGKPKDIARRAMAAQFQ